MFWTISRLLPDQFWLFRTKNGFFLVYSRIAEIRAFRAPKGQMGQKRHFPLKNGLFLVYSTIAKIRGQFDHFGPQKGR